MACFLLHNFIRGEMLNDPIKQHVDADTQDLDGEDGVAIPDFVDQVEPSTEWNQMRDELANTMWNNVCLPEYTLDNCLITLI